MMHDVSNQNDILLRESFQGIKKILDSKNDIGPVLIIVKNIKAYPPSVLNNLIHLIKKYRDKPNALKLNLILGVQNNNREEIHYRI